MIKRLLRVLHQRIPSFQSEDQEWIEKEENSGITARFNVTNVDFMLAQARQSFHFLRFDSTNNCNLQCVYCHNPRSKENMDLDKIQGFFKNNVSSVRNLIYGCIMEPTLDKRMADIMMLISESPANPKQRFGLQTNGLLLHLHDYEKMKAAGLNQLSVSVDSSNAKTFRQLRGNASLDKVEGNLRGFRTRFPDAMMQFMITVNTANICELEDLVAWGIDLGINRFQFREMFFDRSSKIVNHESMKRLLLSDGAFTRARETISEKYGDQTQLVFATSDGIMNHSNLVDLNSQPTANQKDRIFRGNIRAVGMANDSIKFEGWLLLADGPADSIDVLSKKGHVVVAVQCERPDIAKAHESVHQSLNSGFEFSLPKDWYCTDRGYEFLLEANRGDVVAYRCRFINENEDSLSGDQVTTLDDSEVLHI